MPLPVGVATATVTFGSPASTFFGGGVATRLTVEPTHALIHRATKAPLLNFIESAEAAEGMPGSITLPLTDQEGFSLASDPLVDFTGWAYKVKGSWSYGGSQISFEKNFQLVAGQTVVDLDEIPGGSITLPVSAPIATVTSVLGKTGAISAEDLGELGVADGSVDEVKLDPAVVTKIDGKLDAVDAADFITETQADASYAPVDDPRFDEVGATTVDALTDAGAVGKVVAKASTAVVARNAIGAVPSRLIPDISNSWWQNVQSYLVNGRVFVGGCGVDGGVRIGWVDLENGIVGRTRLNPERYFQDDHDSVGLAFDLSGVNRRALAVYSAHDDDNYLRLREAEGYNTFESVGPEVQLQFGGGTSVAYGSVMAKPAETNKRVNTTSGSAVLDCVTSVSAPVAHGLVNGMRFRFTTAGAPAPFVAGVPYWVVDSTADTTKFGLAATVGGAAITATATSSDASKVLTDTGRGLVRCRNGGFNKIARSTNLQVSVTERPTSVPPSFEDTTDERFTLIEAAYIAYTEAGNTFWAIATGDPTPVPSTGSTKTYFFKGIKGGTGAVRNAAGNIIGHLWGAPPTVGAPLIPVSGAGPNADMIYDATGDDGRRYYDISRGGDAVAVMSFHRPDYATVIGGDGVAVIADPARAELGGTYKVMRRMTSATTNAWMDETIVPTGKPFGAYKSVYVGGFCFERDDTLGNAGLAVVEDNNVWSLRRYVRTGPAYPTTTPGTWAEQAILYTAPVGYKLGRPKIPLGSEGRAAGERIFTVSEYSYYDTASFNAIRGGEIVGKY